MEFIKSLIGIEPPKPSRLDEQMGKIEEKKKIFKNAERGRIDYFILKGMDALAKTESKEVPIKVGTYNPELCLGEIPGAVKDLNQEAKKMGKPKGETPQVVILGTPEKDSEGDVIFKIRVDYI